MRAHWLRLCLWVAVHARPLGWLALAGCVGLLVYLLGLPEYQAALLPGGLVCGLASFGGWLLAGLTSKDDPPPPPPPRSASMGEARRRAKPLDPGAPSAPSAPSARRPAQAGRFGAPGCRGTGSGSSAP